MKESKSIGSIIVAIIIFLIVEPFLLFWFGYFDGWLAKILIGNVFTNAINTIFHINFFTKDMLPMLGGVLGFVGSFFKNTSNLSNK